MNVQIDRALISDVYEYNPPDGKPSSLYCRIQTTTDNFRCRVSNMPKAKLEAVQLVPVSMNIDLKITASGERGHYLDVTFRQIKDALAVPPVGKVEG